MLQPRSFYNSDAKPVHIKNQNMMSPFTLKMIGCCRENTSGITEKYIWHNSAAMFAKLHQTECVCIGIDFSYGGEHAGPETLLPTT
jgi:hypothetical protein